MKKVLLLWHTANKNCFDRDNDNDNNNNDNDDNNNVSNNKNYENGTDNDDYNNTVKNAMWWTVNSHTHSPLTITVLDQMNNLAYVTLVL